jgi:hypothetical protein
MIEILDPTGEPTTAPARVATRIQAGAARRIGVIDNGKPNAGNLLDGLLEVLGLEASQVRRFKKRSASEAADSAVLGELSECGLVVTAIAD